MDARVTAARTYRASLGRSALFALLAACSATNPRPATAPAQRAPLSARARPLALHYRVRIEPDLAALHIALCMRGALPDELVSGLAFGARALRRAVLRSDAQPARELDLRGGRLLLPRGGEHACVDYDIDLTAAVDAHAVVAAQREHAVVTNTALWLLRPLRWESLRELSVAFELPEGVEVSVPWRRVGDAYPLDPSALEYYAFAAFGRFETLHFQAAAAELDVSVLEGLSPATRAALVPWLSLAAEAAALPLARFPRPQLQIVVVPSAASAREPVRFAMVGRGGGASALMLVSSTAELPALRRDWVAIHEFCHLLLPFLQRADAWLSEGVATYYQEVLRVRMGLEDETSAWQRLYDGAALGGQAPLSLAQESAAMFQHGSFRRVYWGGAAFALMSDVELRARSAGRVSLDSVLRDYAAATAGSTLPLAASDLLAALDSVAARRGVGSPVFSELARCWVQGTTWPELSALYARLGLSVEQGRVHVAQTPAGDAPLRRAITQPVPASERARALAPN